MMQKQHKETKQPKLTEYIIAVTRMYPESHVCMGIHIHTQSLLIYFHQHFVVFPFAFNLFCGCF